ncbi:MULTISPECIES: DUF6492 family protein [Bradyrhizobium]|uniref:Glycosyl transferase family 8 n=1 Tax=Bradyrhizobium yuanmingense TaxID=108015 RepID=A0A0R3D143_9BRAD|nr:MULTISPECIES: DUF6492 family protein [Bradyrhizobium]MCA1384490.1 hypothetical protein [Bradyrhizobium sp. BRP05]KRQ01380.1 hypothetical protein AOQ72_07825 [Bradyrhizobium yuanmingense]MCA1392892.1 hypothetical protein [Bradyrhizobium sp. IC3123]MCA1421219.1 hypothetical protein [Bradyrhizobium sp. BRP23]MCA1428589.1 hypothetical protein [Bradyrhizobium sp. NBAIM16]
MHSVALLTASYAKDIERFSLLSESIDTWLSGYTRHYVLVNDEDVPLFARFASDKRVIVPASRYLPKWLFALPPALQFGSRRVWLSLLSSPVHGWHIQQILKIAGVLNAPEQRVCILDSDNLFFREFDVSRYAGAETTPLFVTRKAIAADHPLHGLWLRTVDQLLGIKERAFPADDYVGNALVWDRDTARAMTDAIKSATGLSWALALCRKKKFSEYLLYGNFVANAPEHLARHRLTEDSIAVSHWDDTPLDRPAIEAMMRTASPEQVALCIQSYSSTSIADIRDVFRLSSRERRAPSLAPDHIGDVAAFETPKTR